MGQIASPNRRAPGGPDSLEHGNGLRWVPIDYLVYKWFVSDSSFLQHHRTFSP